MRVLWCASLLMYLLPTPLHLTLDPEGLSSPLRGQGSLEMKESIWSTGAPSLRIESMVLGIIDVRVVRSHRHVGSKLSPLGEKAQETQAHINNCYGSLRSYTKQVLCRPHFYTKTKVTLLKTLAHSRLWWAAPTWYPVSGATPTSPPTKHFDL